MVFYGTYFVVVFHQLQKNEKDMWLKMWSKIENFNNNNKKHTTKKKKTNTYQKKKKKKKKKIQIPANKAKKLNPYKNIQNSHPWLTVLYLWPKFNDLSILDTSRIEK